MSDGRPLLVLLHGYGADPQSMGALAARFAGSFRIAALRAPLTLPDGGFAWARTRFTPDGPEEDPREAAAGVRLLAGFLQARQEEQGAPAFLLGFSQGAAMALGVALARPDLAAGVASIGGRVLPISLPGAANLDGLPVFLAHGTEDAVVPLRHARAAREALTARGAAVTYREYAMGHEIGADCLRDLEDWLQERAQGS